MTNGRHITAADVLRRYMDEELPAFCGIQLESVNQVCRFGERPLHVAATRGIMEEVAALVEAGAEVNAHGELGNTPLHEAVGQNHVDVAEYLLNHGALATAKNDFGDTPIDIATRANREELAKVLRRESSRRRDLNE